MKIFVNNELVLFHFNTVKFETHKINFFQFC